MSRQLQFRRGTQSENDNFTGAVGEITYDETNKRLRIHDSSTRGGFPIPKDSEVLHPGNAETISGVKTFTATVESTKHSATLPNNNFCVKCEQAVDRYADLIGLYDTTNNCRCATIRAFNTPTKHGVLLGAHTFANAAPVGLEVYYDANGQLYTTTTTPASDANDSRIATANWTRTTINSLISELIPVGTITIYGGTSAPTGWLMCNGQAVNRQTYSKLFSKFGTYYGTGDGSTTFNLPDFRHRVPMMGWWSSEIIGAKPNGKVPNITGKIGELCVSVGGNYYTPTAPTGAFSATCTPITGGNQAGQGRWIGYLDGTNIDASRVSSLYQSTSTVEAASVLINFIVKY